jgi:hypothetical protein
MVSNSLRIDLQDLLETIKGMRAKYGASAEYQKLRRDLPEDWPL